MRSMLKGVVLGCFWLVGLWSSFFVLNNTLIKMLKDIKRPSKTLGLLVFASVYVLVHCHII